MPRPVGEPAELLTRLRLTGMARGGLLALAIGDTGLGVADQPAGGGSHRPIGAGWALPTDPRAPDRVFTTVAMIEAEFGPRWVWWSKQTAATLIAGGVRPARCWDLVAVHRLLFGGAGGDPATIWAAASGLDDSAAPSTGQLDLLRQSGDEGEDPEQPVRPDGYLRPEWTDGGWRASPMRLGAWAAVAFATAQAQQRQLRAVADSAASAAGDPGAIAYSESAAELLCAELEADGLPIELSRAEQIIASSAGPRPRDETEAAQLRARRDTAVLSCLPGEEGYDLRKPAQVRAMLARAGIDVPDTRSWRLEAFRGAHPVIEALLAWRKAERVATTYGYDWLDRNVGSDGRLRGRWSGSDGAAGRMTAQAGLHNMPAELRPAVAAEPGHALVRADLGQIEPRVLAAVSGDRALAAATRADDLYAPVAATLGVQRSVAKVAVLAAMYGQTSGAAGRALAGLDAEYPVAMRYLRRAYEAGRSGRDLRTHGGRLIAMWSNPSDLDDDAARAHAAARGRYARNAVVQGAAAEFFKAWAATVRARVAPLRARIVLCLHDELLLHAPAEVAPRIAQLLHDSLAEAARRWSPERDVRFVADVAVIQRWSEAKG